MRFERYGNAGMPNMIGVAWLCPQCDKRSLDLVPMHTELPSAGMCFNCGIAPAVGTAPAGVDPCPACGVERAPLIAAITQACGSPPTLSAALELIDRGLIRLAANAIDLRLEQVPDDSDTWLAKAEMLGLQGEAMLRGASAREPDRLAVHVALQGLLAQRKDYAAAILALDHALPLSTGHHHARLLHAKAELLCMLERAEDALETIDEALLADSSIARWHYVRGWALGMLGELEPARESMVRVLELAPDDPSAARALMQIDQALRD